MVRNIDELRKRAADLSAKFTAEMTSIQRLIDEESGEGITVKQIEGLPLKSSLSLMHISSAEFAKKIGMDVASLSKIVNWRKARDAEAGLRQKLIGIIFEGQEGG